MASAFRQIVQSFRIWLHGKEKEKNHESKHALVKRDFQEFNKLFTLSVLHVRQRSVEAHACNSLLLKYSLTMDIILAGKFVFHICRNNF